MSIISSGISGSLEELSWQDVRLQVKEVNPTLAKIIDDISPSKEYGFYKVKYPFGSEILKRAMLHLPFNDTLLPITDPRLSHIKEKLGNYNLNSNPASLMLKNTCEIFLGLEEKTILLPSFGLISPGKLFGTWRLLSSKKSQHPAFIWSMTAGARTLFMLPKISERSKHEKLRKEFNLTFDVPRGLISHWEIFRSLANDKSFGEEWDVEILFFHKKWFDKPDDKNWVPFTKYLLQTAFDASEFGRNDFIWDIAISLMQQMRNIRPVPYIADTVKHLLTIGVGVVPGFSPAIDDIAGPIKRLEEIYSTIYGLAYAPIIMQPHTFVSGESRPVYYSLSLPTITRFSPRSREESSKLSDLYEIKSLLNKYLNDLSSIDLNLKDTLIYDLPSKVQYDFFHTETEVYRGIQASSEIPVEDTLFANIPYGAKQDFPANGIFVNGCVRIKDKLSR
ncbi:MAG: hypothetical protein Q7V63_06890 [Gammaproteobacteria bacterium]|nr:hypothetical protein [Gammaproteobacteria bacterium]